MLKHTFQALLVVCVATGTLLAAKDPFVGTRELNQGRSKIKDLGGIAPTNQP